ncbi:MAG: DUF6603 domain-containing protein, partial [Blastocatellia bacterium]|nr:DUF6603 domain-containing protein [Blastocatellia bacterium]
MSISLADLKAVVRDGYSGNRFELPLSRLQSNVIDSLAGDAFPAATLTLTDAAAAEESDGGDSIIVRGQGVDAPFTGLAVEARFFLAGGDAAFHLIATGGTGWSFAQSFPLLTGAVTNGFTWMISTPPQLQLLSVPIGSLSAGLSFNGSVDLNRTVGGLASLVGRSEQPVAGILTVKEGGGSLRSLQLEAPISEHVDLKIATVDQLTFKVGSNTYFDVNAWRFVAVPFVGLSARIPFQSQGNSYAIPVSAKIADLGRDIRFEADITDAIDAGLHELSSLTQGVNLGDFIPSDFRLENILRVNELSFDFNATAPKKLTAIGLGVRSVAPWKIFHLDASNKDLTVENVQLSLEVVDPLGGKFAFATVRGDLGFGANGRLVIEARYPDFQVSGALMEGAALHLDEVIGDFLGPAMGATVPNIEIASLSFLVGSGRYEFAADVYGPWNFGPFSFLGIRFDLARNNDVTQANLAGYLSVAGVDVELTANHPADASAGWEFQGSTGPRQSIPIGAFVENLASLFGDEVKEKVPAAIADLRIEDLGVNYKTKSGDFSFTCKANFPIDSANNSATISIAVVIAITHENNSRKIDFGGTLEVKVANLNAPLVFNIKFEEAKTQAQTTSLFVASYSGGNQNLNVGDLIRAVAQGNPEWAKVLDGLSIDLKDALFAFHKTGEEKKFLFGLDIGASVNLSNLPLVGKEFPPDQTVGVEDLQLLVASRDFTAAEANAVNALLPNGVTRLPVQAQGAEPAVRQGANVAAQMKFGGVTQTLALPVAATPAATPAAPAPAAGTTAMTAATDNAKWFTVQKTFGPVHFGRVGVQYQNAELWFLLEATLSAAGLTLSLDGLAAGSPLSQFKPEFKLNGLGIDYKSGPVEIAGAFLRRQAQTGGQTYDEYDGAALIKTEEFALSATGSYAYYNGAPSLFVYGVLDYPLGGPAFFFVTGLAAGFGYNRGLIMPPIEQVASFPLVAQAIQGPRETKSLDDMLKSVSQYIPPDPGQMFLAVGVKFTSFKIIDSFVLLTVAFGNRFELNLLGLSTLVSPPISPPNVPPLAVVQMAIRAAFLPDEGFLGVQGQLTAASYIFTRDCHITGGFAFFSWFKGEHAGDFVQTIGGYHPGFSVPSHYPKVPRVGISWQVDANLSIKGEAYYALTSSALMAGGSLQAVWQSGDLKAWFNAGADFLIAWKPYHYDAHIYVNMGVSYTFSIFGFRKSISVDVSADLHIWGPDFSGTAHIKLWIVSFDVRFGAAAAQRPTAIGWADFKSSFLPGGGLPDGGVCGISISRGLVKQVKEAKGDLWIVNPKEFCLTTDSVIPSKEAYSRSDKLPAMFETNFGVGPMEVVAGNLASRQTITITRNGAEAVEADFTYTPVRKRMPAGMWGQSLTPTINGQKYIEDAVAGFEIRPKSQPAPGQTANIDRANLRDSAETIPNAYRWENFGAFTARGGDDPQRRAQMRPGITDEGKILLSDLLTGGFELTITDATIDAFLIAPQIGEI